MSLLWSAPGLPHRDQAGQLRKSQDFIRRIIEMSWTSRHKLIENRKDDDCQSELLIQITIENQSKAGQQREDSGANFGFHHMRSSEIQASIWQKLAPKSDFSGTD